MTKDPALQRASREASEAKLKIGRAWTRLLGNPLCSHEEAAEKLTRELGEKVSVGAVKQAEAHGAFRYIAVLVDMLNGDYPPVSETTTSNRFHTTWHPSLGLFTHGMPHVEHEKHERAA